MSIPSWSWASTDTSIRIPSLEAKLLVECAKVVNVHVSLDSDLFGSVTGGVLTMRWKFLPFCTAKVSPDTQVGNRLRALFAKGACEILIGAHSI